MKKNGKILLILLMILSYCTYSKDNSRYVLPSDYLQSPDSCNNQDCYVDSLLLNTGFDQNRFTTYQLGQRDFFWEIVMSPDTGMIVPSSAYSIFKFLSWPDPFKNTQWISAYNSAWMATYNPIPRLPYSFQYTFCSCGEIDSLEINLRFMADDTATVYFDSGTILAFSTNSLIPVAIKKVIPASPGLHGIRFDVRNTSGSTMGLCAAGTVKLANPLSKGKLLSHRCCFNNASLSGRIIYDKNCNGIEDNSESGLSGWKVQLLSGSTIVSEAFSDKNGLYSFNNLTPGFYNIKEIVPQCWYPSNPNPSIVSVNLGAKEKLNVDFLNCKVIMEPLIAVIGNNPFCEGESIRLITTLDYNDYKWSTGETTKQIQVSSPGKYSVIVRHSAGCTDSAEVEVFQNPKPQPEIVLTGNNPMCTGDTLELSVDNIYSSYKWSTGDTTRTVFVTDSGLYRVDVTDISNCSGSSKIKINRVISKPTIELTGNNPFCENDSVRLTVKEDFASYNWSTGEALKEIIVTKPGFYFVQVRSKEGCIDSSGVIIKSNPKPEPEIVITGTSPFCVGDNVILSTKIKYNRYYWSNGSMKESTTISKAGIYSVQVIDSNECLGESANIIIDTLPTPKPVISGNDYECRNSTSVYSIEPQPESSIEWFLEGGNIINGINTPILIVKWDSASNGKVKVKVTGKNNCTGMDSMLVKIGTTLIVKIQPSKKVLCKGSSLILRLNNKSSNYRYLWSDNSTDSILSVNKPGIYYIMVSNLSGCLGYDTIQIREVLPPAVTIIGKSVLCPGETVTLSSSADFSSYSWSTGETTKSIPINNPGTYSLNVTDTNGCSALADFEVHSFDPLSLIENIKDYNFGSKYFGNRYYDTVLLKNGSKDDIEIQSIDFSKGSKFIRINFNPSLPYTLKPDSIISAGIEFLTDEINHYQDSLVFSLPEPCNQLVGTSFSAKSIAKTIISLPDTSAYIGDRKFRLPLTGKLSPYTDKILKMAYRAKIRFDATTFLPEIITNGILTGDTIIGTDRIITIYDNDAIISGYNTVLTEITGTVLLGTNDSIYFVIDEFKWENDLVEVEKHNGELIVSGVCTMPIRKIMLMKTLNAQITPNPASEKAEINISAVESGTYTINLYNFHGEKIYSETFVKNNVKYEKIQKNFYIRDYPQGVYLFMVNSPSENFNKIFSIIK